MADFDVVLRRSPSLSDSECQRRIRAAFRLILSWDANTTADGAPARDTPSAEHNAGTQESASSRSIQHEH